jgi:hypothetical protein
LSISSKIGVVGSVPPNCPINLISTGSGATTGDADSAGPTGLTQEIRILTEIADASIIARILFMGQFLLISILILLQHGI